jgi:hypothetical protein
LRKTQLGPKALDFVRSELAQGRALAQACITLDLGAATLWATLPPDVASSDVENFSESILDNGDRWADVDALPFIRAYLGDSSDNRRVLVFEHPYASPTDPGIERDSGDGLLLSDESVYRFASGSSTDDEIWKLFASARLYPGLLVLSQWPDDRGPGPDGRVTGEQIRELALAAVAIFVAAWDAEHFIVCELPRYKQAVGANGE